MLALRTWIFQPHGASSGLVDRMVRSQCSKADAREIVSGLALIEAANAI
jgi:hypothetical protein